MYENLLPAGAVSAAAALAVVAELTMAAVSSYLGPDGTRLMGMPSPGGAPLFAHGGSRRAAKTAAVRVANAAVWPTRPTLTWRVAGSSRTSVVSAAGGSMDAMTGSTSVAALGIATTAAGCCCSRAAATAATVSTMASNGTAGLRGFNLAYSLTPPSPVAVADVVDPARRPRIPVKGVEVAGRQYR